MGRVAANSAWVVLTLNALLVVTGGQVHQPGDLLYKWSDFGIEYRHYTGQHHNFTFQTHVWVRMLCRDSHVEARMVTAWHGVPVWLEGTHATIPAALLTDDSLPDMWFQSLTADPATGIHHVKQEVDANAIRGGYSAASMAYAVLRHHTPYSLSIRGSADVHEFLPAACRRAHPLFTGHAPVWVVASNHPYHRQPIPRKFGWLVAQHAQHHRCLGLQGLMLVTTARKAHYLLQQPDSLRAMRDGTLVIVVWVSFLVLAGYQWRVLTTVQQWFEHMVGSKELN